MRVGRGPGVPVMPRKTCTTTSSLLLPLRGLEEDRDLPEVVVAERRERGHRRARASRRRGTSGAGSAKSMPRPFVPRAQVGAPRLDEPVPRYVWQVRQPDWAKSFAPGTAFAGRFSFFTHVGDRAERLARERLLRRRALVGEGAHRDHGQDRDHDRHRPPRQPPLAPHVHERQREHQHHDDRRDPDRPQDHRVRPLEDPEQVEEEVEVPVGPRDEARRPRVGLVASRAARASRRPSRCGRRASSTSRPPRARRSRQTTTRLITVSWNIAYG